MSVSSTPDDAGSETAATTESEASGEPADIKRWDDLSKSESNYYLGTQTKNAVFELASAKLEVDGEVSIAVIHNAVAGDDIASDVVEALRQLQPVEERHSGNHRLVVRDE